MEVTKGRRQLMEMHQVELNEWAPPISVIFVTIFVFLIAMLNYRMGYMTRNYNSTRDSIASAMQTVSPVVEKVNDDGDYVPVAVAGFDEPVLATEPAEMTPAMAEVYTMNDDSVGWLKIDGTVIDYPVMQTMDDEQYYLNRDFNGRYSAYGCILADTDSVVGTGTRDYDYTDGTRPSTNIILHGHNMKNGSMFGGLDKYRDSSYEKQHSIIKFSSLYEDREYEVCAVFLSQVYKKSDDVFKYYKFFQADTQEEFDDFYNNIKQLSMYDTGVTAQFGDEFLTMSVCAYHVENGRLVVVAKRIK